MELTTSLDFSCETSSERSPMAMADMRITKMEEEEEEPGRREASASTSSMEQPNFTRPGVTKTQISKFQELQRKILQIKAKSKKQKGSKGPTDKSFKKNLANKDALSQDTEDPRLSNPQKNSGSTLSPSAKEKLTVNMKKQKLHWGLDVKERWERKANM